MSITNIQNHLRSFVVVIFFGLILVGASCKDSSLNPPTLDLETSATTTPEQAWAMYVEGWKKGNIEKILQACGPIAQAQDKCRKRFESLQKLGNVEKVADAFSRGKLTSQGDQSGDIRLYSFYLEDEERGGTVSFEYFKNLGWRITEF